MLGTANQHNTSIKSKVSISEEEVRSLCAVLKRKYGIDFTNYEIHSLTRGMNRVLLKHKMESTLDLWSRILVNRDFLRTFIDDLTVNLTELFRNPDFWMKVRDVLPQYTNSGNLRIWHAGCSTGEEVYTMAILLSEMGLYQNAKIVGSDLSSRVLAAAEVGEYHANFKRYSKSLLEVLPTLNMGKYFDHSPNQFSVKKHLKSKISFVQNNLVKGEILGQFNMILCRNVMIYFDEQLKMRVLEHFYNSLEEDALFIIGYYDMMPQGHEKYFTIVHPEGRIYKRNQTPKG